MESAKHSSRTGLIVLVAAALVLVGTISFVTLRGANPEKSATPSTAIPAADQPPTLESLLERTRAEPTNVEAWLAARSSHRSGGGATGSSGTIG